MADAARSLRPLRPLRHLVLVLRDQGWTVHYPELDDAGNCGTLAGELQAAIDTLQPGRWS
jgi:deoxyribodipyrimidine photolyase-related protein